MCQDVHSTSLQQGLGEAIKSADLKVSSQNLYIFIKERFPSQYKSLITICTLITFTKYWLCEERIQYILPLRCSLPFTSIVAYIYVIKKKNQKDLVLFKLLVWGCTPNVLGLFFFFLNICKDRQWVSPSKTSFTAYVKLPATASDWVSRLSGKASVIPCFKTLLALF